MEGEIWILEKVEKLRVEKIWKLQNELRNSQFLQ